MGKFGLSCQRLVLLYRRRQLEHKRAVTHYFLNQHSYWAARSNRMVGVCFHIEREVMVISPEIHTSGPRVTTNGPRMTTSSERKNGC